MLQPVFTSAHITIPTDWLPLVTELVTKAGGTIEGGDPNACVSLASEVERGGRMLRALRQRAGMTQKELADSLGLPQSHISEFENDHRAIPYRHAQRLAKLLHSIPSHFMTPNAETIAAMNGAGEDGRQTYATVEAMCKDLGI